MKILVVEDEALVAMALQWELEENGLECILAATAEEALDRAVTEQPQLIFMDVNLAGDGDGVEAACEITRRTGLPICFVSGYSYDDISREKIDFTPLAFLQKPVRYTEIASIIEEVKR